MVGIATTREQALKAAEKLKELGVHVATVDGNLNPNNFDGADGRAVLAAIRAFAPEVKVVGVSGLGVEGADVNVQKKGFWNKLGNLVKKL